MLMFDRTRLPFSLTLVVFLDRTRLPFSLTLVVFLDCTGLPPRPSPPLISIIFMLQVHSFTQPGSLQ
jgi:hypothetical protein